MNRTWNIPEDMLDALDRWSERTGVQKQLAIQVGIWMVVHADPIHWQALLDMVRLRPNGWADPLLETAPERVAATGQAAYEEVVRQVTQARQEPETRRSGRPGSDGKAAG